jgi:hypothetical protein
MYTHEDASIAFPLRLRVLFEAIFIASGNAMERIRSQRDAAHYEQVVSKLSPHLRYDIGEIDHQPPPLTLREIEQSNQQSLATIRQRYY